METAIVKAACAIGAGIAIGFGAIGPAVGEGSACLVGSEMCIRDRAKRWKAWPASRKWQTCCVPT